MTTSAEAGETHPAMLTVKLYVPAVRSVIVVLIPVPVTVPPGVLVNVQVPDAGKPLNSTLPVETVHDGCVEVPMTGAVGTEYNVTNTAADGKLWQPDGLVTRTV